MNRSPRAALAGGVRNVNQAPEVRPVFAVVWVVAFTVVSLVAGIRSRPGNLQIT